MENQIETVDNNLIIKSADSAINIEKSHLDLTVEALEKKLEQAKKLRAQKAAKLKRALKDEERRKNNKRKILVGAYMLSKLQGPELHRLFIDMQNYLKHERDKNLFAL